MKVHQGVYFAAAVATLVGLLSLNSCDMKRSQAEYREQVIADYQRDLVAVDDSVRGVTCYRNIYRYDTLSCVRTRP